MMRRAALALALLASPAAANDSTAVLAAGGLVLTRSAAIRMAAEDLHVTPGAVTVRYRFRNTTPADIRTTVAFPLPEIDLARMAETAILPGGPDPDDFVDFRLTVDGRPVPSRVEMRAWRDGREVTDLLAQHGLPASRFHSELYPRLRAMPPDGRAALTAAGLVAWEMGENVYPLWTMRAAYHWEQVFPAGRDLAVEHRYRPVVGQGWFGQYLLAETDEGREWRARHCVDPDALARLRAKMALTTAMDPYRPMRSIAYVLTTAANWQGPIGRFRLKVESDRPDSVVVGCLLDVEAAEFRPDRDLAVAIVD